MQLVYFNDLHKNLGCNRDIASEISIIPVTFTVLSVKFYALQLLPVSLFFCPLSPSADKRPVGTDISIAQKTCVFHPVDISVPAVKYNKLIYQSVYSLSGILLPSAHCVRSHLPQGDGFWRWRKNFRLKRKVPGRASFALSGAPAPAPPKGEPRFKAPC